MTMLYPRVGVGHDTHRLVAGNGFYLGGVFIPHSFSLHGHSDADVLLHAVTDAILGACAMGDIGEMFPDTAEENKGRSSVEMLHLAYEKVRDSGWGVGNLDCIVFAQNPKLKDFKAEIAKKITRILNLPPGQVGVKAKTGEGVGIVGEGIVIMAQCVVLLTPLHPHPGHSPHTLAASRSMPDAMEIETPHLASASRAELNLPSVRKR